MNKIITNLIMCLGMCLILGGCYSDAPDVRSLRTGSAAADKTAQDAKATAGNAAKKTNNKSCLQIVGGAPTSDYSQVGLIYTGDKKSGSVCTGTFLSDTTMITASHCLQDSDTGGARYIAGDVIDFSGEKFTETVNRGISSVKAFIGAPSLTQGKPRPDDNLKDHENDIAILLFPPGTFKNTAKILTNPLVADQELTLVGFGAITAPKNAEENSTDHVQVKRVGTNRLAKMDPNFRAEFSPDYYFISGNATSDGLTESSQAVVGHGDSGGPLFLGQAIAAIASAGNVIPDSVKPFVNNAESQSLYASLQSAFARQFLANAIAGGAGITFADDAAKAEDQRLNVNCSP